MKLKLYLIPLYISLLMFNVMLVSGIDFADNNNRAYYTLQNLTDSTGVTGNLTNSGGATGGATGIIDDAYDFEASSNDYMDTGSQAFDTADGSISFWLKPETIGVTSFPVSDRSGSGDYISFATLNANGIQMRISSGGSNDANSAGGILTTTNWTHVVGTWGSGGMKLYINGNLNATNAYTGSWTANTNMELGRIVAGNYYDGVIDEVSFWNTSLNQSEVTFLYSGGSPTSDQQYPFSFPSVPISTNLSSVYVTGNFSVSVNTTTNVNMSYSLDNSSFVTICNDCNVSIVNFTNVSIGNHNISWRSIDGSGTLYNNETFEIQPNQYFRFRNNVTGGFLSDYTFGGVSSVGQYVTLNLSHLSIGNNSLLFNKAGFENRTINVILNNSAQINDTYNVTPVTLSIRMFDADSITTQLTFNVTILNSSSSAVFNNQVNFSQNYTSIPTGSIELRVTSDGYSEAFFYQTITPFTSIELIGYLISVNNTDVVTFNVIDKTDGTSLSGVVIEAQELINGSSTTISQATTGDNGETFMFLDLTKVYTFIFTKSGYTQAVATAIPSTTSYTVKLDPEGSTFDFIDGVNYNFVPSGKTLYNNFNYTFKGFISGTGFSLLQYRLVNQNGTTLFSQNSTNPTGTTFTYDINNLNSSLYTELNQSIIYTIDGVSKQVSRTYDTTSVTNTSFIYFLKYEVSQDDTEDTQILRWIIIVVSIGGSMLVGRVVGTNQIGNSLLILIVAGFFTYIDWIPDLYFGAILILTIMMFVGTSLVGVFK